MTAFVLSPRAQADINEIWDYTAERWGDDQAERYLRTLMQAIETIARESSRARASDRIRPGYRRYSVGSHVLFFRVVGDGIDVVRVLHQHGLRPAPVDAHGTSASYRVGTGCSPR